MYTKVAMPNYQRPHDRVTALCALTPLFVTAVALSTKEDVDHVTIAVFVALVLRLLLAVVASDFDRYVCGHYWFGVVVVDLATVVLSVFLIEEIIHTPLGGTDAADRAGAALVVPSTVYFASRLATWYEQLEDRRMQELIIADSGVSL